MNVTRKTISTVVANPDDGQMRRPRAAASSRRRCRRVRENAVPSACFSFSRFLVFSLSGTAALLLSVGCESGGGGGGGLFQWDDGKGEQWTIRCFQSSAPNHEQVVDGLAAELKKVPGLRAGSVRVKHEAQSSTLYYGTYRKQYDAQLKTMKFPPELTRDISVIRSLTMGNQVPFLFAQFELMNRKNIGPPEWDLVKAPGEMSLQVAVFFNEADFQERELAAVQYCEALRKEGFEAYYHHYDTGRSVVCVGSFPASAVTVRMDGTEEPAPEVRELIARKEEFKYNLVNGRIVKFRGPSGEFQPTPSCLIRVPRPDVTPLNMEAP